MRGVGRDGHDSGIRTPLNSAKPILELVVVVDHQLECSPESKEIKWKMAKLQWNSQKAVFNTGTIGL